MRKFEKISFEQFTKDIRSDKNLYQSDFLPKRSSKNSAGYDFFLLEEITLKPKEKKVIPTGIKARMQPDEFLMLTIRSSIGFQYRMCFSNTIGIIDADYYNNPKNEGHIFVSLENQGDQIFYGKKGDKVFQGIFMKYLTEEDHPEKERTSWSYLEEKENEK